MAKSLKALMLKNALLLQKFHPNMLRNPHQALALRRNRLQVARALTVTHAIQATHHLVVRLAENRKRNNVISN